VLHDLERRARRRFSRGERHADGGVRRLVSDESALVRDEAVPGLRAPRHQALDHHGWGLDSGKMPTTSGALRLRLIFGAATVLGFFSAFTAYYYVVTFAQRGKPASFPLLLLLNLNYWYSWALITPGILWLARRFPFERASWIRSIPVHVVGVFVCVLAHVTFVMLGRTAIYSWWGESQGMWTSEFQRMFFLNFDYETMTYWTIVGISHALRYHYEAQDRALRASRLETRLMEAQLQTLQRQLQPHFLFNTLNTIAALMHRDVEAADAMLARLGDLLRLSFETLGVQEVALEQELDFLRQYVAIEQARFRERLTVSFDVADDALECLVPNLLLQPLVENAIRHGIGPRVGPGHVLVRAARSGSLLELEVRDDGVGVPPARWRDLEQGVGLSNTRSRLVHLYGDQHRFEVREPAGGGVSVLIAIPVDDVATEASEVEIRESQREGQAMEGVA
jgi:two-component system LytT family sensor kinase